MAKEKSRLRKWISMFRHYYSLYIVRNLWVHWFNPLYTLYFNFIFLPFKQAIRFPVFIYGWPKLYAQMGNIECIGECYSGMVRLNVSFAGGPQYAMGNTELTIWGKIIFRGKCLIGSGDKIVVGGILDMGKDTKLMNAVNVTAHMFVRIDEHSRIAHRSQILDSNYHYIADFRHNVVKRLAHPIKIGKYCWVCNSTTITGGAVIPDKIIVASNSLVNKNLSEIPEESIVGGVPAKLVATGFRKIESVRFEKTVSDFFMCHSDEETYLIPDGTLHSICDVDY